MKVKDCNVLIFFSRCQKISLLDQTSHRHDLFFHFLLTTMWKTDCQQYNNRNVCRNNRNIIYLTISFIRFLSHITGYITFTLQQAEWITHFLNVIHCLGSHNLPTLAADVCEHTAFMNLPLNHQPHDPQTPLQIVCFQGLLHEKKQDLKWDLISRGRSRHTLISGVNWQTQSCLLMIRSLRKYVYNRPGVTLKGIRKIVKGARSWEYPAEEGWVI